MLLCTSSACRVVILCASYTGCSCRQMDADTQDNGELTCNNYVNIYSCIIINSAIDHLLNIFILSSLSFMIIFHFHFAWVISYLLGRVQGACKNTATWYTVLHSWEQIQCISPKIQWKHYSTKIHLIPTSVTGQTRIGLKLFHSPLGLK